MCLHVPTKCVAGKCFPADSLMTGHSCICKILEASLAVVVSNGDCEKIIDLFALCVFKQCFCLSAV